MASGRWRSSIVEMRTAVVTAMLGWSAAQLQAQAAERAASRSSVSGAISITNKGISVIPTFTLGRPAAIIDLVVRKERLSFEPQFRAGLDGKPWSFLFWGRYQVVQRARVHVQVGAHPAVLFRKTSTTIGGNSGEYLVARRYLATEVAPTVLVSRHVSVGAYYLYSRALERDVARNTNFVAARAALSDIPVGGRLRMRLDPQLFYLSTDRQHGEYANGTVTIGTARSPISVSASANTPISTNIVGGTAYLWNVSLNVAFR